MFGFKRLLLRPSLNPMRYFFLLLFSSLLFTAYGQRKSDIGFYAGMTSYMGDINPNQLLYSPSMSIGGLFRYNFHERYSLKITGIMHSLKGNDEDFSRNIDYRNPPASFKTRIFDISSQFEINFLPYITGKDKGKGTSYVLGGLGMGIVMGSDVSGIGSVNPKTHFHIPFGLGYKYNATNRLGIGMEVSFRKTFSDNIDGVPNHLGESLVFNNDWYNSIGLFITYKFFKFAPDCPVYK